MNTADAKLTIQKAIRAFSEGSMTENAISLFSALAYNTQRQNPLAEKTFAGFQDSFLSSETRFRADRALAGEWKSIVLLFQLTKEEVSDAKSLFDTKKVNGTIIESYLFFAVELEKSAYSRTALAQITREINRVFPMPVMLVFKYGEHLTFSMINRRLHKRDESKDVLEKVTLIKDISIAKPHRAHVEILFDLSFEELKRVQGFSNFVELHNAWQKTLDTKELSKKFFQELANWYFWATEHVSFPDDMEKNRDIRNATSLIRLITRIIFIWFIKEKNLVPENLFNPDKLNSMLKDFNKNRESRNYYNAILQNLFFACLNRKMNERSFAKHGTHQENRSEYGVKTLFRYADMFTISKDDILNLFENIPFLNGGLFDCLDRPDEDGRILYTDGFSRNPKKQASVPDFLFFGKEQECDLNAVFGTKNRKFRVKGLISLLESYKFTVAENTPVEEEIALDPELLGKVFENLLASYNPETQTTARKQTGSFYTPREIVSYMVDESLTAYLKQKLEAHKSENTESRLRDLFSYSENPNPFDEKETQILINAIDNCRILDPACGSGAFPMGILHKMVHVLHKLDTRNRLWKEQQMAKVEHLIAEARNISDSGIRDKIVADLKNSREDIEEAFASNELDYGRKLYLIESCIYGVDIQPIAIQISKLRFFISLIVDQRITRNKENFGVRSLPNLETKFVAANTLIGLDKPKQRGLKNLELEKLEKEMKDLRHRYFSAKSRREKLDCQKKDRELRNSISEFLIKNGWNNEAARQLAAFDPYDQNAGSPFFDQEWMFGIKDGFDVVIGNPPYVDSENMKKNNPDFREQLSKIYKTTKGNWDLYIPFYEKGFYLLKDNGILSYITPNKWLSIGYGKELRNYLKSSIYSLCNCLNIKVFEAGNSPIICFIQKEYSDSYVFIQEFDEDYQINRLESIEKYILNFDNWGMLISKNISLLINLLKLPKKIGQICSVENPFTTSEAYKIKDYIVEKEDVDSYFKFINTGTIDRYITKWGIMKTTYLKSHLLYPVVKKDDFKREFPKRFIQAHSPKIIITGMRYFECFLDSEGSYIAGKSTIIIREPKEFDLKFIIAILNSKLISFYINQAYSSLGIDGGINFSSNLVENLPFPKISISVQQPFISLVDYILFLKKVESTLPTGKDQIMSSFFEQIIDGCVYELYFEDSLKKSEKDILKYLYDLPAITPTASQEQTLAMIKTVFTRLYDREHPVSQRLYYLDSVKEIRIIKGLEVHTS